MFHLTESAEPVCVSTGRFFRRDCVLVRIPSDTTRLNHDFSGQFVFPLPNRQEVSHVSHNACSTLFGFEMTLWKVFWPKQSATDFDFVSQSTYSQTTMITQVDSVPMMPISVIVAFDVVRVDVFRPLVPVTETEDSFISMLADYQKEEWVEHFRLTSHFCLAYLEAPLLSLSCVTGHCVTRAYVAQSAQRLQRSQN